MANPTSNCGGDTPGVPCHPGWRVVSAWMMFSSLALEEPGFCLTCGCQDLPRLQLLVEFRIPFHQKQTPPSFLMAHPSKTQLCQSNAALKSMEKVMRRS